MSCIITRTLTGWTISLPVHGGAGERAEFVIKEAAVAPSAILHIDGVTVIDAGGNLLHAVGKAASTYEFAVQMARPGTANPPLWPWVGPNHGGLTPLATALTIGEGSRIDAVPNGTRIAVDGCTLSQVASIVVGAEHAGTVSWSIVAAQGNLQIKQSHHYLGSWAIRTAYQRMIPGGTGVNRSRIGSTVLTPVGAGAVVRPGRFDLMGVGSTAHPFLLESRALGSNPATPIMDAAPMGTWMRDNADHMKLYDNMIDASANPVPAVSWSSQSALYVLKGAPLA